MSSNSAPISQQNHVAFIHPDLGIGGAQQLVVNLCLAGKKHNYQPHIYTPYHHRSFPQTHDGTITIHEHGSFFGLIPDTIFGGKGKGILAYIRSFVCALWLIFYASHTYKVVVADQVSVVLPLLRMFGHKTIFYCHYPDKLLAGKRNNLFKRIYRLVIDFVEEISLLFANKIYVNSQYTKEVFYQNFKILRRFNIKAQVLYPALEFSQFDENLNQEQDGIKKIKSDLNNTKYIFSLNRYERKKNINLAIEAFGLMKKQQLQVKSGQKSSKNTNLKLVIAGGYDPKVRQNIEHLKQLRQLAQKSNLQEEQDILFYTSISNDQRKYLLKNAQCVLYTPQNEHFGIVPCEAMYCDVPVIAHNSGGPKQSVTKGCGYLCSSDADDWKNTIWKVLSNRKQLTAGKQSMINKFGMDHFAQQFKQGILQVQGGHE